MKKKIITSALVAGTLGLVSSASAATITMSSGTNDNAGGLTNVVDGDHLRLDAGMGFTGTADSMQTSVFTVQEAGNSVTLRMHWDTVGAVTFSNGVAFLQEGESVTISFDLMSGALDSFALDGLRLRALTSSTDGTAGEGFTLTDNSLNSNTWYSVKNANHNPEVIGGTVDTFTSSSTYAGGNPASAVDPDTGLNVLSQSNLGTWSWTIAGIAPGDAGGATSFALNLMTFDVTPSAIPEPSSAALLGLGGLALILRRRK